MVYHHGVFNSPCLGCPQLENNYCMARNGEVKLFKHELEYATLMIAQLRNLKCDKLIHVYPSDLFIERNTTCYDFERYLKKRVKELMDMDKTPNVACDKEIGKSEFEKRKMEIIEKEEINENV